MNMGRTCLHWFSVHQGVQVVYYIYVAFSSSSPNLKNKVRSLAKSEGGAIFSLANSIVSRTIISWRNWSREGIASWRRAFGFPVVRPSRSHQRCSHRRRRRRRHFHHHQLLGARDRDLARSDGRMDRERERERDPQFGTIFPLQRHQVRRRRRRSPFPFKLPRNTSLSLSLSLSLSMDKRFLDQQEE